MKTEPQVEKPKYELVKLGAVEKNVNALVKQFHGIVYDVTTTKGMETARKDRALLVSSRSALEQARKEEKADVIERGKFIDSTAAKIKETILSYETPLDDKIKEVEAAKAAEKAAKLLAEQERIEAIQKRIDVIKNAPLVAVNKSAEEIRRAIAAIAKLPVDASYEEFEPVAQDVKESTLFTLNEILAEKEAVEAEAIRLKAEQEAAAEALRLEREELDKLRKEAAEREALLELQRAKEREEQAKKDAILEKQRKDEQEAYELEMKARQAKMDAELAEQRKKLEAEAAIEREKLAAERAEQEKEAYRLAEEARQAQIVKDEAERAERERLDAEKTEAERKALAKKTEAMAKKLTDPVAVIQMCYDTAINDKMACEHKLAMIKGLAGAFLERAKG